MEKYDVLVIGSGSGMSIADGALNRGMKVAVVESGPLGGTCLNRGCIPSKNVIYPADVIKDSLDDEMKKIWLDFYINTAPRSLNNSPTHILKIARVSYCV